MKWFLRVEKVGERKKKEVDAKHLLFLWGEWTAKRLLVWFKGRVAVWRVGNGDLMMKWHECHLFFSMGYLLKSGIKIVFKADTMYIVRYNIQVSKKGDINEKKTNV